MPDRPFERLSYDPEYDRALSYLYGLQKFGIKFGLSKTKILLRAFADPQQGLRFIHIAGSNGKGSVAAMLASIYARMGYRVGLFTSPHLIDFRERFQINGRMISQDQTLTLIREIREKTNTLEPPTFFEFVTALAVIYFQREKVDLAIMEVGLGGRLDATNVIQPLVSVITTITREHQDYLGKTLEKIALEKAGIIKAGVPLVAGVTQKKIRGLLEDLCRRKGSPLFLAGRDFRTRKTGKGKFNYLGPGSLVGEGEEAFRVQGERFLNAERRTPNAFDTKSPKELKDLQLGLLGDHQIRNAGLALTVIRVLSEKGFAKDPEKIRQGLGEAAWPGRLEVLSGKPRVLLDGAHNPGAMRTLSQSLRREFTYRRLFLLIGMMKDKDLKGTLKEIVPLADSLFLTRAEYDRSADPRELLHLLPALKSKASVFSTLPAALNQALKEARPEDLICITGSLFVVGEARAYWQLNIDPELH